MISKGYHYVINLGIVSNFNISIDPAYSRSLSKNLSQRVNSGESGFSLLHRSSSPLSKMNSDWAKASIKSLCFIFTIPFHFIHSTTKVSKYYFVFISLIFIFHIKMREIFVLQSFKETPPNQLLPGAISSRGINTEDSVIRGSNLKGHKTSLLDQCQPQ